jgi:hypothetical protein
MKYRVANPARARKVGDEIFSLTDNGDLLSLGNESAVLLWERLCREDADVGDLTATLLQVYNVDDATARRDAQLFLDKLAKAGVLKTAP